MMDFFKGAATAVIFLYVMVGTVIFLSNIFTYPPVPVFRAAVTWPAILYCTVKELPCKELISYIREDL